jgi:predicted Zn-dependent protease
MMQNLFITIFLILLSFHNSYANIIRDSEIEETIDLVTNPLKKNSGLQDLKIFIINDENPNAFTLGGKIVFIHSGLITKFPDPDVLRGVVAHEIGHIIGQHISRRQETIDNYTLLAMGSAAIGLVTAIGTGSPGLAIMIAGNHVAERSVQAYSRVFESSADQMALNLLEKSHHSSIGMIKFFEQTQMNFKSNLINRYDQTHPLSHDRLLILKNHNKKSKFSKSQNSKDLLYKFHRSSVKLAAYTTEFNKLPDCDDNKENLDEFTNYMKAIKFFRTSSFDNALNHVNKLLMKHPKDPYYHELKAQILFEAGKNAALTEYNIACEIRKNDPLMLLSRAIVGISIYSNEPSKLTPFYNDLLFVIEKEPNNLLALYYMAIYYEKKGLKAKSYLNSAIIAHKSGNRENAKNLAAKALKELNDKSPDWYKAKDIIAANT